MSADRKPSGEETAMGKLKKLCREKPALRDELYKLSDEMKSAVWRAEVKKRFSIWLSADSQVTRWRDWAEDQQDNERLNDRLESFGERYRRDNPSASEDQIRSEGIRFFMERAIARGNQSGFESILDRDQAERIGKTKAEAKRKDQELSERRIKLLEGKVKAAQAEVQKLKKPSTSDEERTAIIDKVDEILGLK